MDGEKYVTYIQRFFSQYPEEPRVYTFFFRRGFSLDGKRLYYRGNSDGFG